MTATQTNAPAATPTIGHNGGPSIDSAVNEKILARSVRDLKKLGEQLTSNKQLATVSAKTRGSWADYGRILSEVREIIKSNNKFNAWLKEFGLEEYADRNARTDAMWLSTLPEDFLDEIVPAELHAPKRIREWYRKTVGEIYAVIGDKSDDALTAKLTIDLRNVYDALPSDIWEAEVKRLAAKAPRVTFASKAVSEAVDAIITRIGTYPDPVALATALAAKLADELARIEPFKAEPAAPTGATTGGNSPAPSTAPEPDPEADEPAEEEATDPAE